MKIMRCTLKEVPEQQAIPPFKTASFALSFSILILALLMSGAGFVLAGNGARALRIRSAPVRTKPSFDTGSREGTLYFGQSCEVVKRSTDWIKIEWSLHQEHVSTPSKSHEDNDSKNKTCSGWVHETAFYPTAPETDRPISEWVIKGAKGLAENKPSQQTHDFIRARHLELKPVLKLESGFPSAKATEDFLKKGRLGLFREDWPSLFGVVEGADEAKDTKRAKP